MPTARPDPHPPPHGPQVRDALGHGAADRRIGILRAIAAGGSISQAAREVGVSYKAAWQALDTLTNLAGVALVDRAVGGSGGGGAAITPAGRRLLDAAAALDAARDAVLGQWGAGTAPDAAPALGLRTSMRNQWPARVLSMARRGATVQVDMALGDTDGPRVLARITRESAELLGLREGLGVLALCKATAVAVRPVPAAQDAAGAAQAATGISAPRLAGVAARLSRPAGSDRHEVTVALAGTAGLQLVGFAAAGTVRVRQRVDATVAPEALVLALP